MEPPARAVPDPQLQIPNLAHGKDMGQYIIDAMREHGFPEEVAIEHARNVWRSWLDLQGHHLLQAIWNAQEPKDGPEFAASFMAIFERDFLDLLGSLAPAHATVNEAGPAHR